MKITISDYTGKVVRNINGTKDVGINRIQWNLRGDPPPRPAGGGQGFGGGGGGGGGVAAAAVAVAAAASAAASTLARHWRPAHIRLS